MLKFIGGRFHMPGASFTVPDGYYIETAPEEAGENHLYFQPSDHSFRVSIAYEEDGEAEKALNALMEDMKDSTITRRITPVKINGLSGWDVMYHYTKNAYYEARFQLPDGNNLELIFFASPDMLNEIVEGAEYRKILDGIRCEDTGIYGE